MSSAKKFLSLITAQQVAILLGITYKEFAKAFYRTPTKYQYRRFDIKKKIFEFRFRNDPEVSEPTKIFVPRYQYPNGCHVEVSDGEYELNMKEQTLTYWHSDEVKEHLIRLKPN